MKSIYLASSWRNEFQPKTVIMLREAGFDVYDFRAPVPGNDGFRWNEVDEGWKEWTPQRYRESLNHPVAQIGFNHDFEAMKRCEEFCLLLPCGRSAHLEAGWAIGQGKKTSIYIPSSQGFEPELMYLTGGKKTRICLNRKELLNFHYGALAEPVLKNGD